MDYQINPETILGSLDRGDRDVFTPIMSTPNPDSPLLPSGSIPWKQLDYLKIANALSQYVWNEPLDLKNWSIYYLSLHRECQDNPVGFDYMEITYYKITKMNWPNIYPTRHISIYPLASLVSTGSSSDFASRYFAGSNQIDFTKFNVTADDALQTAEENGGKEARKQIKNNCSILINAPLRENEYGWGVSYYFDANFEISINPYTGSFRILTGGK
ncbi:MAG: hypothetical protein ABI904_03695 [Chloroflexota bacterium]